VFSSSPIDTPWSVISTSGHSEQCSHSVTLIDLIAANLLDPDGLGACRGRSQNSIQKAVWAAISLIPIKVLINQPCLIFVSEARHGKQAQGGSIQRWMRPLRRGN
jgi:hypothetical protein